MDTHIAVARRTAMTRQVGWLAQVVEKDFDWPVLNVTDGGFVQSPYKFIIIFFFSEVPVTF